MSAFTAVSSGAAVVLRGVLRRRRLLVLLPAVVLLVAAPVLVLAADGRLGSQLDRQSAAWTTTAVSTSSTEWRNVPRLALTRCTRDQVTATVSVRVTGAPVFFRLVPDGVPEAPFKPGAARFSSTASSRSRTPSSGTSRPSTPTTRIGSTSSGAPATGAS